MRVNDLQRILLNTYKDGLFAELHRWEDLRNCNDPILVSLFQELSDEVILSARKTGMDAGLLAWQRLSKVTEQISRVGIEITERSRQPALA